MVQPVRRRLILLRKYEKNAPLRPKSGGAHLLFGKTYKVLRVRFRGFGVLSNLAEPLDKCTRFRYNKSRG